MVPSVVSCRITSPTGPHASAEYGPLVNSSVGATDAAAIGVAIATAITGTDHAVVLTTVRRLTPEGTALERVMVCASSVSDTENGTFHTGREREPSQALDLLFIALPGSGKRKIHPARRHDCHSQSRNTSAQRPNHRRLESPALRTLPPSVDLAGWAPFRSACLGH